MNLIQEHWTKEKYKEFTNYLYSIQDQKYKEFHSNLVPNINELIGIKIPELKKIAKKISKGNYKEFINLNKHNLYEEKVIHGFIITNLKLSYNEIIKYINDFLPYIDNWAICDTFCASLKTTKKYQQEFYKNINELIKKDNTWTRRFCFVLLLDYYLEKEYLKKIFKLCNQYNNDEYYVKMAVAWLISIAYIKHEDETIKYIKKNNLDDFTHNKIIQKITESKRIDKLEKEQLKLLKR